jgi:NTE family protein
MPADPAIINSDLLRTYGDGYYEHVDYSLDTLRGRNILRVTPLEKSWGPDYLRYGVNLDSNFKTDSTYSLRLAYQKTWLNRLGGEFLAGAEIGSQSGVSVDLYQPVDEAQRYFVESTVGVLNKQSPIYQNNDKIAVYQVTHSTARILAGINLGLLGQLRAGWEETWFKSRLDTGSPFLPEASTRYGGWFTKLDVDQTDRLYFPTSGWTSSNRYFDSQSDNYSRLDASLGVYHERRRLGAGEQAVVPGFAGRGIAGVRPGQPRRLRQHERFCRRPAAGRRHEVRPVAQPSGSSGACRWACAAIFASGSLLEAAKIGRPFTETNLDGWINSTALYLGGETPLGPVYLGYGYSSSGSTGGYSNLYLFLGTP